MHHAIAVWLVTTHTPVIEHLDTIQFDQVTNPEELQSLFLKSSILGHNTHVVDMMTKDLNPQDPEELPLFLERMEASITAGKQQYSRATFLENGEEVQVLEKDALDAHLDNIQKAIRHHPHRWVTGTISDKLEMLKIV